MDYSLNVPYTNTMATDYTTINSQNLTQTPSVKLPTYQPAVVDPNLAPSVLAGIAGQFDSVNMQNERALQEQQANRDQQNNLSSALLGKTADTQAFQDQAGVNAARATQDQYTQQIYDLNAQASSLMKEGEAAKQNAVKEGRQFGSVQSFVTSQQNEIERNRAIKALEISANADIAQASLLGSQMKLQAAKDKAQQMVDLKYKPLEDQLAIKKEQYELNKDVLSSIDKKRTEALNAMIKKEERDIAEAKANEKGVSDLVTNAAGQGAPEDIRARAAKAKTPMEAANILGMYAGDYMKMQTYKSQLETDKAQRANIYSQIAERNKEAIKNQQLANFQAPPILNAQTGKIDPKSALASVIKSTGGKLKGGQSALDVLSSVQGLAERNPQGVFQGIGLGSGAKLERFMSPTEIANRQDINAIGLKVQQWASGASLTKEQTEMVDKFTPQLGDSDNAVKNKINGLVNFMMGQVSSDLVGQGINYSPETIDMFSGIQSVDNKTFLGGIPSAPTDTTKLLDNKTFFNRQ